MELQKCNKIKYTVSTQNQKKKKIEITKICVIPYNFLIHLIFIDLQNIIR